MRDLRLNETQWKVASWPSSKCYIGDTPKLHIRSLTAINTKIEEVKEKSGNPAAGIYQSGNEVILNTSQDENTKILPLNPMDKWKKWVAKPWLKLDLPPIAECKEQRKTRKRKAGITHEVAIPPKADKHNQHNSTRVLEIRWHNNTNNDAEHLSKTMKRCRKQVEKESETPPNTHRELSMKILQSRIDHQLNTLSGVFKRLKLESEEVR